MLNEFKNKVVLITGASAGIGKEFAIQLHELGCKVILLARRLDLLNELTEQFNLRRPNSAEAMQGDLGNWEDLRKTCDFIKANQIDMLINNAGRGSFGEFEKLKSEQSLIDLNITATLQLAQAVIPQMKSRRSGSIVSLASIVAFQPLPFMSTYAATKAFNFVHSMGLREELAEYGVKVLVVCPGPTATEFGGVARVPGGMTGVSRDSVEAVVKESLKALSNNKAFVITGFKSKFIAMLSRVLPVVITAKLGKLAVKSALSKVTY